MDNTSYTWRPVTLFCSWLLVLVWGVGGIRANQCQIENGKCTYHVRLSSGCDDGVAGPLLTNQIQNDYNEKVNEIERNLIDVRVDHHKRIAQLENRISQMLVNPVPVQPPPNPGFSTEHGRITGTHQKMFKENDAERKENTLLNNLHEQFTALRRELARLKRKLRTMEQNLFDARNKLNSTQLDLEKTRKRLNAAEQKLEDEKEKNSKLQRQLNAKDDELERTKAALNETNRKLSEMELQLQISEKEKNRLRDELSECRADVEDKVKQLDYQIRRYENLEEIHLNTTIKLNKTTHDLIECYRGKKSNFCGFEDPDYCGFIQDEETDTFDWTWWSMQTPSSWTGPDQDHTCANHRGHYMYVEASSRTRGSNAKLVSPKYQGADDQCMEFYYHMWGSNIGTLNVYFMHWKDTLQERAEREAEGQDLPPPVWRAFGNQGNVWTMARLQIPAKVAFEGYKVVFEALMESGAAGDIGLDDIRIFTGSCQGTPTLEQWRVIEGNKVRDALAREGR